MENVKFNKIDLNKYRTEEVSSIFTREGVFSDGRPYITECWAEEGCTMLTIFIPSVGFKIFEEWNTNINMNELPTDIQAYLEKEGYKRDFFSTAIFLHCFGDETDKLLSINILVGINDFSADEFRNWKKQRNLIK